MPMLSETTKRSVDERGEEKRGRRENKKDGRVKEEEMERERE